MAFLGVTVARAVAAPLNPNYTKVRAPPLFSSALQGSLGSGEAFIILAENTILYLKDWHGTKGLLLQGEFAFFIEDAASKLLLVPPAGNKLAEQAAADLNVPVAALSISKNSSELCCTVSSCHDQTRLNTLAQMSDPLCVRNV